MKIKLTTDNKYIEASSRSVSFTPVAGLYRVQFSEFRDPRIYKQKNGKFRVYWNILFPIDSVFTYRVWKDYRFENESSSMLEVDLKRIFRGDLSEFCDEAGMLDPSKLLGKEAEAKVGKKFTEEYNEPLTIVEKLHHVGCFKLSDSVEEIWF